VDWYEPPPIDFPPDVLEGIKRGTNSTEMAAQEEREKSALMAVYMTPEHIPDTPSDIRPGMDGPPDESETKIMAAGDEVAHLEAPPPPQQANLQDLLARIAGTAPPDPYAAAGFGGGSTYPDFSLPADTGMDWSNGGHAGQSDLYGQTPNNQSWSGQGLPPPTGSGYNENWEQEPPTGPRRAQRPWQNFPPGIRYNAPCKFYNSRAGCRNGSTCPFIHGGQ